MSDAGRTIAVPFSFQRPLDSWARWFAVVPTRSYVRLDDHGFEAVYGLWRVATVWSNVVERRTHGAIPSVEGGWTGTPVVGRSRHHDVRDHGWWRLPALSGTDHWHRPTRCHPPLVGDVGGRRR